MPANNSKIESIDKAFLERIYKQYWSELYIYAFNVLHERDLSEDIVQEVFVDLWSRRHDLQIINLKSYLYKSVKYQIFNSFRKSKYKKQLMMKFDSMMEQYQIYELYEKEELKDEINDIVSKLPKERRLIFQMSRNGEMSNKEISEKLNISLQTVKNQISGSLKIIRKSLKNLYFFLL